MAAKVQRRELTAEERQAVERLARSRADEARLVGSSSDSPRASGPVPWPTASA